MAMSIAISSGLLVCVVFDKKAALDCTEKSDGQFMRICRSRKRTTLAHLYKPKFD